ncbi:MAG: hypothetical protein M3044_16030 [Thermoproteota archaeon]|nr:hypothetical protein [Thermoproteota archaeon]
MIDTKRIVNTKKNTPLDIISQYDPTSNLQLLRLEYVLPFFVFAFDSGIGSSKLKAENFDNNMRINMSNTAPHFPNFPNILALNAAVR